MDLFASIQGSDFHALLLLIIDTKLANFRFFYVPKLLYDPRSFFCLVKMIIPRIYLSLLLGNFCLILSWFYQ
uniref:Uncharacterized protein n=1 Tax=Rhizophora mucronata TaxID=61149 RepID=A0A2P2N3L5_RHIMU